MDDDTNVFRIAQTSRLVCGCGGNEPRRVYGVAGHREACRPKRRTHKRQTQEPATSRYLILEDE